MTSSNTPQNTDESQNQPATQLEKKEPLSHVKMTPLEKVNGFIVTTRRKVGKVLAPVLLVGAIGAPVGGYIGEQFLGFNLNPPKVESKKHEAKGGGIGGFIRRLGKAGADAIKNTDFAKNLNDEIFQLKKAINRKIYWVSFFLSFLAAAWATSKAIKAKRSATESAAPVVDQNFKTTEENLKHFEQNLNAAVDRINAIYDIVTNKKLTRKEEDVLIKELEVLSEKVIKLKAEVDALKAGSNMPMNNPVTEGLKKDKNQK